MEQEVAKNIHIGHAIQQEMQRQGRNVSWLASQISMTDRAIYKIYDKPSIQTDLLRLISNALRTNFFNLY